VLDPDHDAFVDAAVVAPRHDPFGEAPDVRVGLHPATIQSPTMGLRDAITSAFSFLRSGSQNEERIAQYVIREHHRGRPLSEVVEDHYVTNRCSPEQLARILERGDVVHAVGEDAVASMRAQL
jgi:hypothetical protein